MRAGKPGPLIDAFGPACCLAGQSGSKHDGALPGAVADFPVCIPCTASGTAQQAIRLV